MPADLRWLRLPGGSAPTPAQAERLRALDDLLVRLQPPYARPRDTRTEADGDALRVTVGHEDGGGLVVLLGPEGYASLHWPGGEELDPDRLLATAEALLTGRNRVVASVVRGQVTRSVTTLWDEAGTKWKTALRVRRTAFPPLVRSRSTVSFERPAMLGPAAKAP